MKIENWGDLFKYNKELLEDDYNHGQGLVVKTKAKAVDNVTVSSYTNRVTEKDHEIGIIEESEYCCTQEDKDGVILP